jgi:hypothetical protein
MATITQHGRIRPRAAGWSLPPQRTSGVLGGAQGGSWEKRKRQRSKWATI